MPSCKAYSPFCALLRGSQVPLAQVGRVNQPDMSYERRMNYGRPVTMDMNSGLEDLLLYRL